MKTFLTIFLAIIASLLLSVCVASAGGDQDHGCLWGVSDGTEQAYARMDSWLGFKVKMPPHSQLLEWAETRAVAQGANDAKAFVKAYLRCFEEAFRSIEKKKKEYGNE